MNKDLFEQIYANLNIKETEDLLEIWQTNNHNEWSGDAFTAIRKILVERGVEIPEQRDFVTVVDNAADEKLEDWEATLLDNEDQPELYDTLDVLSIRDNINVLAKASVIVYGLVGLVSTPIASFAMMGIPIELNSFVQFGYETFITLVNTGIRIGLTYFPLKALSHILIILVEIEFNSRKRV